MIATVLEILITQPIIFESSFMFNLISPTIPNIPSLESQRETREVPVMTHMSHTTFREKKSTVYQQILMQVHNIST